MKKELALFSGAAIIYPMQNTASLKKSVAEIIAGRFIAELDKGVAPWARGFAFNAPRNVKSKKAYRGINYFLLSMLGIDYALTFKQAQELGGSVKKGAKGVPIVFWNFSEKTDAATGEVRKVPFMRYHTAFSLADTEGVKFQKPDNAPGAGNARIESAETLFEKARAVCGFKVTDGGNQPCFIPALNEIQMPTFERWAQPARFYKTLFHECGHALGKKTGKVFASGGGEYATEELVAELFAAACLAKLGIDTAEAWDNSVAYVQGWAKRLGSEPQAIISAAQEAQKRLDYLFPSESATEGEEGAE